MEIKGKVALVTGSASGIGAAVALELARRGVVGVALVDRSDAVGETEAAINQEIGQAVAKSYVGDTTDSKFRHHVFDDMRQQYGQVSICVPAAGVTRDAFAVRVDRESGAASIYPVEDFRLVTEVNLIAPTYWALEMVAGIAEARGTQNIGKWDPEEGIQGVIIFIGSISSRGNKGQIAYAATKAGLEGVAATLMAEAMFYGVRCGVIHPGFTDTPMVRALGEEFIKKHILPQTQLNRLIRPEEIADAICFMVGNSAVSGELWADAGWHPNA